MKISTENIGSALRSLRGRLEETQESFARRLGTNLRAYQRWESGQSSPRAAMFSRILALCRDEEERSSLLHAAQGPTRESERVAPAKLSTKQAIQIKARDLGIDALKVLAESAAEGNPAAREHLKRLTDRLVRAAGDLQRKKDTQK